MQTPHSPQYERNYGFWNEAEQQRIMSANVAIAGVGGDGFQLGLKLAMMGVQTFDIADPEVFEPQNTNRVPGATDSTYGRKKVDVFEERVLDINPSATVRKFEDGITPDNVDEFASRATLVFDESELTYLHIGTMVARAARKRRIPDVLVMNVGFAAQVTAFHPLGRTTFEKLMGIPKNMPLDEVKDYELQLDRCLPYLPPYADLRTLAAVQKGAPLPSIAQGVDVASALGASQAFLHITRRVNNNRPKPVWAPQIAYVDAYNFKSGITRFPKLSHKRYLAEAVLRDLVLHHNPQASYTFEDRKDRAEHLISRED